MLISANIGKQNGDTRTRKTEPGYLNLSNAYLMHDSFACRVTLNPKIFLSVSPMSQ
jgi:hypothetical protein